MLGKEIADIIVVRLNNVAQVAVLNILEWPVEVSEDVDDDQDKKVDYPGGTNLDEVIDEILLE